MNIKLHFPNAGLGGNLLVGNWLPKVDPFIKPNHHPDFQAKHLQTQKPQVFAQFKDTSGVQQNLKEFLQEAELTVSLQTAMKIWRSYVLY